MATSKPTSRPRKYKDLTGLKVGRWTVVAHDGWRGEPKKYHYWKCECSCSPGVIRVVIGMHLQTGQSRSCGCLRDEANARPHPFEDLTGRQFGRLTVVAHDGLRGEPKPRHHWRCECSCGSGIAVVAEGSNLKGGNSKSCGCLRRENLSDSEGMRAEEIPGEHRTLPEYPGYIFTSDGTVWSCWTTGPSNHMGGIYYELSPGWTDAGYLNVNLLGEHRLVHQVILEAFVGPCPEGLECRHLDGNPANNRPSNLKWGTREENVEDKKRHAKVTLEQREGRASMKIDADDARAIFGLRSKGVPCTVIAERFGISPSMASMIGSGRCWKHATGQVYK